MEIKEYIREYTARDIIKARNPSVVTIGGGTGMGEILRGLKKYTSRLTAIVTVGDDGGSSGRLREDTGMLPPGDIRNCILALADDESVMSSLFNYRFDSGELEGHNFGNLFLAAMNGIRAISTTRSSGHRMFFRSRDGFFRSLSGRCGSERRWRTVISSAENRRFRRPRSGRRAR